MAWPTLFQYQSKTEPFADAVATPAETPSVAGWGPAASTPVRRATSVALLATALAFVPAPAALEAPSDAQYPDRLLPRPTLHASQQRAFAFWPEPLPDATDTPSRGGGAGVPLAPLTFQYVALTGPVLVPPPVEDVSLYRWQPTAPDGFPARRLPLLGWTVGPVNPRGDGDLRWLAQFPAGVERHTLSTALRQTLSQNIEPLPDETTPALSWGPEYPDAITRGRMAAAQPRAQHQGVVEPPTALPISDLRWQGSYPEFTRRTPAPIAARTFATQTLAPAFPVDPLVWQPEFPDPDFVIRWHATPETQQAHALAPDPIALVDFADVRWVGTYPAALTHLRFLPALQQDTAHNLDPLTQAALVPLSWEAHYPSRLLPRLGVRLGGVSAPPALIEVVVQQAPWRGSYPDYLDRARRLVLSPVAPLLLPPAQIADVTTCVELEGLTATQPGVTLAVTQATLTFPDDAVQPVPGFEVC